MLILNRLIAHCGSFQGLHDYNLGLAGAAECVLSRPAAHAHPAALPHAQTRALADDTLP